MNRRVVDIAVVGGGMVGAATALALGQEGFSVQLLDAAPAPQWHPEDAMDLRVVAFAPSSARWLDRLGVWSQVREARIQPYRAMRVRDAAQGAEVSFDANLLDSDCLGWIIENRLLRYALWQALEVQGIECLCPVRVQAFELDENRIRLSLQDGASLSARMLVAADGRDSPLRSQAGILTHGRDYQQRAVVAHLSCERPHQDTAWQRFLPGGPLALLPLPDGRVSLVWSLPESAALDLLDQDDSGFAEAVGVASDFMLGRLQQVSKRAAFPLRLAIAERFAAPRMVLVGDAAHAVHPLAGQGVNLGLRDGQELVAVLAAAQHAGRDFSAAEVLSRYARRRRSASSLDAWSFDAIARLYALKSPPLVALRGFGMQAVQHLPALRRALVMHAAGLPWNRYSR